MALSAWQQQPGSRRLGRPQQVEKAGGAIGRPDMPGPTKLVQVHPLLTELVEEIADLDVPDGDMARASAVHPTTDIAKILQHVRFVPTTDISS